MFGVIGILTQDAIESGTGARAVKSAEDALRVNLVPQTEAMTQKMLASERFAKTFTLSAVEKGPVLTVVPYLVVTFASDFEARPYVVLKTTLKQADAADWVTRYSASVGKPLPLTGENSLTADGGKILNDQLAHDIERAVGAMLDDVMTRHVRDDSKMLYVESRYPYLRQRIAAPGYQLGENDSEIVFLPKFPDATVMAGIHVLDKSQIVHRPATKDDKLELLEDRK